MRVRHLQSHLIDQNLVYTDRLEVLKGARVGVDAVFWLRSIQALKDPFADALGGIPPGIFGFVDKELEYFKKRDIKPVFVFQGVAPGPQHSMFVSRLDPQMEQAWTCLAKGQKAEAQKCFAISTSRINGDFVYFIFHHLKALGYECLQAPYFAGAQLAHLMEQGVVSTVFGPPGLLLYRVSTVIMQLNFGSGTFEWVDLEAVLQKWQITNDQFVDACMLAGTEYCLTYPYLNLGNFASQIGAPSRNFHFDTAVYVVKQAPLVNWMQTFPTEEIKRDHVDGYQVCKVLVEYSPVLHFQDHVIRPHCAGGDRSQATRQVPRDFSVIMGDKLPNGMYYLMLGGIISHKLPQALAKGEWTDKSQPLVDSSEYRELLNHLAEYREKSLGLVARHLFRNFQTKQIVQKAYFESHARAAGLGHGRIPKDARVLTPNCQSSLKWNISKDALEAEMKKQETTTIDFKFCLRWHDKEFKRNGLFVRCLTPKGHPSYSNDSKCLAALVHLMVLENLDMIEADEGSATVLGNVLKESPAHLQEPCLVALELMKLGFLNGEHFIPAQEDKLFPEAVRYPNHDPTSATRSRLLLSRVMSLVPMKLRTSSMWDADVDFDLTAFHSLVRALKRSLRQLVEASLTSVLLQDMSRVKLLPPGFMCSTPDANDHLQTPAILPTFMLPRACMGIVFLFFLDYKGSPDQFAQAASAKFSCCVQPVEDLKTAFAFWEDLKRCVKEIAEPLEAEETLDAIVEASKVLEAKQRELGIFPQA